MKKTPMMKQYLELKEQYPDTILLFRLGDFYEVFFEDAEIAARELEIALTSRNKGEDVPMAGVPHQSAESYINTLIENGHSVAICEQVEDADQASGIVRRDVVQVITPGVQLNTENLQDKAPNFVAGVSIKGTGLKTEYGIAYLDVSTGQFRATEVDTYEGLVSELSRIEPQEILIPEDREPLFEELREMLKNAFFRPKDDSIFSVKPLLEKVEGEARLAEDIENDAYFLDRQSVEGLFQDIQGFGFQTDDIVQEAAASVLDYVVETQRGIPSNVQGIDPYHSRDFLVIDESTKANLELTETLMGGNKRGSLLHIIDETVTSMGGRRLRHWLNYPLVKAPKIERRHEAVEEMTRFPALREDIRELLDDVYDLERLCGKISSGTATARDIRSLHSTIAVLPEIKEILEECESDYLVELNESVDACTDIRDLIDDALVEDPPVELTEGGLFKKGFSDELDSLIETASSGKDWLLEYEKKQIERTGIDSLKVKHNKVYGYFIEVTKANLDKVPDDYITKQTLTNTERYYTPELKDREEQILGAEEKRKDLEYELFQKLRRKIGLELGRLLNAASRLANLDVVTSLAKLAVKNDYARPTMREDKQLWIEDGRHPVVEKTLEEEEFVPNSVELNETRQLMIITGPNMSGKSTVIRQVALITLLAQMGSFVPATDAEIGIVDKIFSRVGANDNLARGQSTFMVEMTETAHILNNATDRSLIILDEIGRGTSTFDGLSLAWAVAEYLHDDIGAKTMFATHYHELTELIRTLDNVVNMSIAVKEWQDEIIFLRKLVEGEANQSYGIQVGKLAGLPQQVVDRAKQVLDNLESGQFDDMGIPLPGKKPDSDPEPTRQYNPNQMSLFQMQGEALDQSEKEVLDRLDMLDVNELTPVDALTELNKLTERLEQDS